MSWCNFFLRLQVKFEIRCEKVQVNWGKTPWLHVDMTEKLCVESWLGLGIGFIFFYLYFYKFYAHTKEINSYLENKQIIMMILIFPSNMKQLIEINETNVNYPHVNALVWA